MKNLCEFISFKTLFLPPIHQLAYLQCISHLTLWFPFYSYRLEGKKYHCIFLSTDYRGFQHTDYSGWWIILSLVFARQYFTYLIWHPVPGMWQSDATHHCSLTHHQKHRDTWDNVVIFGSLLDLSFNFFSVSTCHWFQEAEPLCDCVHLSCFLYKQPWI